MDPDVVAIRARIKEIVAGVTGIPADAVRLVCDHLESRETRSEVA